MFTTMVEIASFNLVLQTFIRKPMIRERVYWWMPTASITGSVYILKNLELHIFHFKALICLNSGLHPWLFLCLLISTPPPPLGWFTCSYCITHGCLLICQFLCRHSTCPWGSLNYYQPCLQKILFKTFQLWKFLNATHIKAVHRSWTSAGWRWNS